MAKTGPRTQPTALKTLRGNPGRRPLPKNEPQPEISRQCPAPPAYLPTGAKKIWKTEAPKLHRLGILTEADISAFAMCCLVLWRHIEAEKMMQPRYNKQLKHAISEIEQKTGEKTQQTLAGAVRKGGIYSVWLNMSHKSMEMAMKYLSEFGMTPSARGSGKISVKKHEKKSKVQKFKDKQKHLRQV